MTVSRIRKSLLAAGLAGTLTLMCVGPAAHADENLEGSVKSEAWSQISETSPQLEDPYCTFWDKDSGRVSWRLPANYPPKMEIAISIVEDSGSTLIEKRPATDLSIEGLKRSEEYSLTYVYDGQESDYSTFYTYLYGWQCKARVINGPSAEKIWYPSLDFVNHVYMEAPNTVVVSVRKDVFDGPNFFRFEVDGKYIGTAYAGKSPSMSKTYEDNGLVTLRAYNVPTTGGSTLTIRTSEQYLGSDNVIYGTKKAEQVIFEKRIR